MRFYKLAVSILLLLALAGSAHADSMDLKAGHSYMAAMVAEADTPNWGGLIITQDFSFLNSRLTPFLSMTMSSSTIYELPFPGINLNDGNHYYMATFIEDLQLDEIRNVTFDDLQINGMFSSSYAPTFYPDYDSRSDSPNMTFCCDTETIQIAGRNYTAFKTTLNQDITYYVLKYGDGQGMPMFLSKIESGTCYDDTPCISEFMLPVSPDYPYYFYAISKNPYYLYNITIDDVFTTVIPQTALVYKLWVKAYNAITYAPVSNLSIMIGEEKGQNIFIPTRLEGYVGKAYSVGLTDEDGTDEFLVAPTVYPSIGNYTLYVGVLLDGEATNMEELTVTSRDALIHVSKPLAPASLYDNAKVSVNAMNQINNYLFKWSSQLLQARQFTVTYNVNTDNVSVSEVGKSGERSLIFKTGAPNVVTVVVVEDSVPNTGYSVRVREQGGYLIMDPYTASDPFTQKTRINTQTVPTLTEFIVTPTSLGVIQSNITLQILDPSQNLVKEIPAAVNSTLAVSSGGTYYNNDLMKTIVNAMNSVLSSMFYSLNN